jgi:hypothetical protein
LTEHDVLETHGLSVLLFHNEYHRVFGDQKMNGMEIILHDQRIVPGGIIPGVVILQPDFPELKEGWPFLWYENEYVVDGVTSFILAANAAHAETKSEK